MECWWTQPKNLRERAKDLDLDVLLIQESQLSENSKTPSIIGYTPIRVDRKNKAGGGIISYIKNYMIFAKEKDEIKDATENSIFSVKLARNKWVKITNV